MIKDNSLVLKKNYVYMFLFIILYRIVIDIIYVNYVSPCFEYKKFYMDIDTQKYIIGFLAMLLIIIIIPKNYNRPSSFILLTHLLVIIIPLISYFSLSNQPYIFFYEVILFFCIECIILRIVRPINILKLKNTKVLLYITVAFFTTVVYIVMIYANGVSLRALNILDVYSWRGEVQYPFGMNYLVAWQSKVINPFMIAISFKDKKYKRFVLFLVLQFILYLITGSKVNLFIPFAIILIMIICETKNLNVYICLAACVGSIIAYLIYTLNISDLLCSLFIRRVLYIPAQLKYMYYDFAQTHGVLNFAGNALGKLFGINYDYDIPISNVIAYEYFGTKEMAANTGYFGTGYLYMGFFGLVLYTLIFILVLICMDSFSKRLNVGTVVGVSLSVMISLNDSDLLTCFVTGGLWLLLVLMYLYYSVHDDNKGNILNNSV